MNGGGNPSVGGGGFAASPAGTAPLYYKSAEIASGSAKNLCKKSEDVGGVCPARHWFALPLWKTQWGACPDVAGAAGVSDTRRGACPVGRLPTLPLACCLAPYPPTPLPRWGRGRPKVYFAGGFAPGTPALNRSRHSQSLPSRYPAEGLPSLPPAYPAFSLLSCPLSPRPPSPAGKGETSGYFMQGASPLASPRLNPRGTGSPCRCGKLNGGLAPTLPARRASAIPGGGLARLVACLPCL